ncbi:MAG: PEP-utilizing enzyme [Patescibacteria group bacterium]|jgi:phosphohistidine swiveling domain-containing protein
MIKNYNFILNQQWEQIVGRKAPPLRTFLTIQGFIQWFQKRFGLDLKNPFITFCYFAKNGISADNFMNIDERKIIINIFIKEIQNNPNAIVNDIKSFRKNTEKLLKISRTLNNQDNVSIKFQRFCKAWADFAAAYTVPILLEKTLEIIVLSHYSNQNEAQAELIQLISAGSESKLFGIKTSDEINSNFFRNADKPLINLLKELFLFRDFRKEAYEKCWYEYSNNFFQKLGAATNLKEYVQWAGADEIKARLSKPIPYAHFPTQCLVYTDGDIKVDYGKNFNFLKEKILNIKDTDEVRGQTAFPGIASGKVKIIMPNDDKHIRNGRVLVTKMTTPDFVPLIKKCAAIVTDEGGVTCHAAIVSREFKVPCVIGTKIATNIFKDGDLIEVNATEGVIKKLA